MGGLWRMAEDKCRTGTLGESNGEPLALTHLVDSLFL